MHNVLGWRTATLSNSIFSLDAGVSVNSEDRPHRAGEVGVLKTSAISGGVFRPEQNKAVLPVERALVAEPIVADSILLSRMNTPALVGECCYIEEARPTLFLPDRIWQLRPKNRADVSMRWLSFVLRSDSTRAYIETHASGTSGSMKNLAKSKLMALRVDYPPFSEQVAIAKILDTLDTTIRQTEAIIEKIKLVKQGLLDDLLTRGIGDNGELRPPQSQAPHLYKDSPLGWLPKEWEEVRLEEILSRIDAGKSPSCQDTPAYGDFWGVLKVGAVHPDGLRHVENKIVEDRHLWNAEYLVRRGDLLFSRANTPDLVGLVCLVEDSPRRLMLSDKTLRLTLRPELMLAKFGSMVLQTPNSRAQIEVAATGTSGSMKNISQPAIKSLLVPRPPVDEQLRIILRVAAMDGRCADEGLQLDKLKRLKQGLMDDLLTGRVRVTPLLEPLGA